MRILQLCIRVPFPTVDGGSIAMYNSEVALISNGATIKVLSFNTIKQFVDLDKLDVEYKKMTSIEAVYLDNNIHPLAAFLNLFTRQSYHVIRFIKNDFKQLLIDTLQKGEFEIIQLESLFMVPYVDEIRKFSKAKIVLRTHNIEHLIWKRMAENCSNIFKKWYLNLLAYRLKKFEVEAINKVDAITALTKEDEQLLISLGALKPVFISPIGIQIGDYVQKNIPDNKVIFHIGAMDWLPNQEGISWFLEQVWPVIKNKYPETKLRLAGKKMPNSYFKYVDAQCEIQEFVPDAQQFMNEGEIMVVPIFSGSGMRVKIIEGLALGKAIISTSIGVEGIPVENGKQMIIANNRTEFIEALSHLLNNHKKVIDLGQNARNFVESSFDNREIGKKLLLFYKDLTFN